MPNVIEGGLETRRASPQPLAAAQRLVQRDALFERLSAPEGGGVVLVCAPAGSGKTMLLRSWIEAAGLRDRVAWVSVERGEQDAPAVLAHGDRRARRRGRAWCSRSPRPRRSAAGPWSSSFCRTLRALEEPAVLVIDDLHELGSADALSWLEVFLGRLPPELRVVLATREDPGLGLHRLRLAGRLTELRAPDLRFSMEEMVELLRSEGITLSDGGMGLLYERTEGWAAGLRLAAISLARHPDPERLVTEFSGSERNVAGYLLAEVLERQPPEVREMLLRTSVLDRVCGPLADFLTGGSGAERMLQELEDANAFVTSLDAGRSWFRYHHLFADLLQLELRRAAPAIVGSLHRAAAQWHEQEGYIVEAIRHAQAAHDWPLASRLLADNHFDLTFDGRTATISRAAARVSGGCGGGRRGAGARLQRPRACLARAAGEERRLCRSRWRGWPTRFPRSVGRRFDVQLAEMRLVVARWRGDLETALESMRSLVRRRWRLCRRASAPSVTRMRSVALAESGGRRAVVLAAG